MIPFFDSLVVHAGVISDAPTFSKIFQNILQFLLSAVGVVAIIAVGVAAVRYLLVRDTDQAADIKKSLVAIVIGFLVLFGAMILVRQISSFLG
jgi:uncharacterized membrane protein